MLPRAVTAGSRTCPARRSTQERRTDATDARSALRLSYCYPEPDRIREGVRRLAAVVEEELELTRTFGATMPHPRASLGDSPAPDLA